ncbi:OmpA family protein [Acetobacteraceae bacterium AT-5844]|nr:OmpA family protein [Acetobacteraceae bacterium AT-5844]
MRRPFLITLAVLPLLSACALMPRDLADEPARVVFFTEDSSALDEPALGVVANAAALAKDFPTQPVLVMGFADPDGGRAYNRALSEARAQRVAEQLRQDGVEPQRIVVSPRGPVPFEMMPLESRRVEIRVGGASPTR